MQSADDSRRDTWRYSLRYVEDALPPRHDAREALARVAGELERLSGEPEDLRTRNELRRTWHERDKAEQEVARLRDGLRKIEQHADAALRDGHPGTPEMARVIKKARSFLSGGGTLDADVAQNHERATGPSDPDGGTRSLDAELMSEPPSASSDLLSGGQAENTKEQG